MLTVENIRSASGGAKYYCQTTNYYSLDGDKIFQYKKWGGKGSEILGLSGEVSEQDLQKILEGKLVHNGENIHLGTRNNGEIKHDSGRDLTFAAPKSVSLQHNLEGGDKRIKKAMIKAAENALEYVQENFTYTRVKKNGKVRFEKTNNIVSAFFYENLNRDKEFHDHVHCVMANMTQRADGAWRSIEYRKILDNKIHIGKVFRMELAFGLRDLGYDLEISDKDNYFFELKGFDKQLSEHFSERTHNILTKAKELNQNLNVKVRQLANFLTRNPDKKISPKELKDLTNEKLADYSRKFGNDNPLDTIAERTKMAQNRKLSMASSSIARKAVGYAIEHLSERRTIFNKQNIIDFARNEKLGQINLRSIYKEINHLLNKEFIFLGSGKYKENEGRECYTTRHALEREKAIIGMMQDGKDIYKSIISSNKADTLLKDESLNNGQKDAAKLILTSKDRVFAIQGYAGTGKTYMLSKLKKTLDVINQDQSLKNPNHIPYELLGLAPSGAAVGELQKSIGAQNARTLQGFLAQYDGYAQGRGTLEGKVAVKREFQNKILIVDEASMLSSAQIKDLMVITKTLDVRTVPVGDIRQLLGVEEGNPFYEMQREGMETAIMTTNVRQKTTEGRAISYSAYARDFAKVFEKIGTNLVDCSALLKEENKIRIDKGELKMEEALYKVSPNDTALAAAKLYISFDKSKRSQTLLIGQSNQTKDLVNSFVRRILIDKEELGKEASTTEILINKNLTIAQRGESFNYNPGNIILFNKGNRNLNIEKDEYFRITSINEDKTLELQSLGRDENNITFNASILKSYRGNIEVYEVEERELRAGDQIMFTRKIEDKKTPIVNSTLGKITEVKDDSYIIEVGGNEIIFSKDSTALKHLDYSYCRTTHKGQGATTNTAIVITESWWSHLTSQRNMLVQATRHKDEIFLVVDSAEKVIQKIVANEGEREGSIEFSEQNKHSLVKKEKLRQKLFKALGGDGEYAKYQIALKEGRGFNDNIKGREVPLKLIEREISSELTKSEDISSSPSALKMILRLEDKSVAKLEKSLREIKQKEVEESEQPSKNKKPEKVKEIQKGRGDRTPRVNRKYIIPEFSNSELSQRWERAITEHFENSNLKNLSGAIEKAFLSNGAKIRFGDKNSCELIWYGKAGYVRDYKTEDELKWGEGNIKLSNEERNRLTHKILSREEAEKIREESENRLKEKALEKKLRNLEVAKRANRIFLSLPEVNRERNRNHPYLAKKNIAAIASLKDIKFTKDDRLVIPIKDSQGKIHSLQYINKDGTKRFLKDGAKIGNFFLLGQDKMTTSKSIFISEGFATATSVHMATKEPVALCFDAGNIDHTLKNLKENFPDKKLIIIGDDDKYTYIKGNQINNGRDKAVAAAEKYNATVIFPKFENKDIDKLRQGDKDAKGPTDFNDLHKIEGIKSVQRQLTSENSHQHNVSIISHSSAYVPN